MSLKSVWFVVVRDTKAGFLRWVQLRCTQFPNTSASFLVEFDHLWCISLFVRLANRSGITAKLTFLQVQFDPYMCAVDGEHELNGLGVLDIGSDDEKSSHTPVGVLQNGQDSMAPTPVIRGTWALFNMLSSTRTMWSYFSQYAQTSAAGVFVFAVFLRLVWNHQWSRTGELSMPQF